MGNDFYSNWKTNRNQKHYAKRHQPISLNLYEIQKPKMG